MRSQPLPGEASRRRAEEQFKTTKKVNSETKANTPSRQAEAASRLAPGNDTNAGSPGFQNPLTGQRPTRRQRINGRRRAALGKLSLSKRRGALDWGAFPAMGEGTTAKDALLTLAGAMC